MTYIYFQDFIYNGYTSALIYANLKQKQFFDIQNVLPISFVSPSKELLKRVQKKSYSRIPNALRKSTLSASDLKILKCSNALTL